MVRRPSSVRLSVCKLLRKSLLLADLLQQDRHQTCTRWSPGKRASLRYSHSSRKTKPNRNNHSRVCKVKGHVIRALFWILGMSYSVIDGLV